jgi:hypothetical protein
MHKLRSLEVSSAELETKTFDNLLSSFPSHRLIDFEDGPFYIIQSREQTRKDGFFEATPDIIDMMPTIDFLGWSSEKIVLVSSKSALCPKHTEPKKLPFDVTKQYEIPFEKYEEVILGGLVGDIAKRMSTIEAQSTLITTKNSTIFAPMVHLTNTSGSGKTRSAIELGNLTTVILIKFSGNNGIKLSQVGVELRKFMKKCFPPHPQSKCVVVLYVILLRLIYASLYFCTKKNMQTGCIFIDDAIKFFIGSDLKSWYSLIEERFFADLIQCFDDSRIMPDCRYYDVIKEAEFLKLSDDVIPKWHEMSLSQIVEENKKQLKERSSRLKNGAKNEVVRALPDLIIVLDEAYDLMASCNIESQVNLRSDDGI